MSYVKVWIDTTDHGGLKHVSEDTFRCFKALELVTYELLKKGATKTEVIDQAENDENVRNLIMHKFTSEVSPTSLHDVVSLWFTIRGFVVTSSLFEQYKRAAKKT